jgi:hypothetical protein
VPEGIAGFARESEAALEALRAHHFRVHLCTQFICSLLFVTGSTLMLFESTSSVAPCVFLTGSLTFAALPVIRLLHEKGHQSIRGRRDPGPEE